jgi:HK97 family phage major capsid protein
MSSDARKASDIWHAMKSKLDAAIEGGRSLSLAERAEIERMDAEYDALTAAAKESDAAPLERITEILDSAAGRPLTRSQQYAFERFRGQLPSEFGDLADSYSRGLLEAVREAGPERPELFAELGRWAERQRLVAKHGAFKDELMPRVEAARGNYHDVTSNMSLRDLAETARRQGFAAWDYKIDYAKAYRTELRALQSDGGSAVPTEFADLFTIYQRTMTPTLDGNYVNVISRPDGRDVTFSRLTADPAAGGTVTAELGGITKLDATISAAVGTAYKYGIISEFSYELLQDNAIALEKNLAFSAAREIALDAGQHLTTGDGSSKPWGYVARATAGSTASGTASGQASDTFFSYYDLVDLYGSLAVPYRSVGTWFVSPDAFTKVLKMKSSTGEPIVYQDPTASVPATLMGRPVVIDPGLASVGSASKSVVFGDGQQFAVVRVGGGPRIEISAEAAWGTDAMSLRVIERIASDLLDVSALKYMVSSNT